MSIYIFQKIQICLYVCVLCILRENSFFVYYFYYYFYLQGCVIEINIFLYINNYVYFKLVCLDYVVF